MIGEAIITRLELIGELGEGDKNALLGIHGEVRELQRGEDILTLGERPSCSVVVLSGMLQRYKLTAQGRRQIHSFYIPSDIPSMETIPPAVMDNSVSAVARSSVGLVAHPELQRIMQARPRVLEMVWRDTLVQAAIVREWLMRNSQMLAHAQMAHFFCEIMLRSRAAGLAEDSTCNLPIIQEDMADALGMSPVHVNRTLTLLRASGYVEFRGGVLTITDWDHLAEIAEFDPSYLHLKRLEAAT